MKSIIAAWGDDPGNLKRTEVNAALLETVRKSSVLKDISNLGKAVALTLPEIAADGKRNFALIHFSGGNRCQVDIFIPFTFRVAGS